MRQTSKNVSPMSNEGRNAYVIRHLTDAILHLLADKPIQDISISELCDVAGVGRASFYRNYESKEDILKAYINQIFHEWLNKYTQDDAMPVSELIRSVFMHLERHADFYKLLNNRNLIFLLKDVLIDLLGPKPEHAKDEAYARAFVSYSLYGWIETWFQRGMQESVNEMVSLFKSQGL